MRFAALARIHFARGDLAAAVQRAEVACAVATLDPSLIQERCIATNILGRALLARGHIDIATRSLAGGCRIAEQADDRIELCHSRGLYGVTLGMGLDFDAAEREIQAASDLADELADPIRLLAAWHACALFAEVNCDWDLGVISTAQLLAYAEEHKIGGHYLYMGTLYAGRHQFHVGHIHRARMLIGNALNLSRVFGTTLGRSLGQAFLGDVNFVEGNLEEALTCYEEAILQGTGPNGDETAVCLGLTGRLHVKALQRPPAKRGGNNVKGMKNVKALLELSEEVMARIVDSGNRALFLGVLDRIAESLEHAGLSEEAAKAHAQRESLVLPLAQLTATSSHGFWPRIPDTDIRASGMEPRDFWQSRQDRGRTTGEWPLPTQAVSPKRMLTAHGALTKTMGLETTASAMPSRTVLAPHPRASTRTVSHTGLLEALASVEGFIPALFEDQESGT